MGWYASLFKTIRIRESAAVRFNADSLQRAEQAGAEHAELVNRHPELAEFAHTPRQLQLTLRLLW
jgi:hypothetical protein